MESEEPQERVWEEEALFTAVTGQEGPSYRATVGRGAAIGLFVGSLAPWWVSAFLFVVLVLAVRDADREREKGTGIKP